jgi:hypothetical protein
MIRLRVLALALALFGVLRGDAAPPLVVDFELNAGGFTPSSATSWKWGPPTNGPGAAHSGTQVWGTNLTSTTYSTSENAVLTSGPIDLSGVAGQAIVIHWWQYLVTEEGFDWGYVEVSKDSGGTWEAIFGPRSGVVNDVWTQHTATLDPSYAVATFLISIRLVSDAVASEGGFFVDDLRLTSAPLTPAVPSQDFEGGDGGYVASGTNSSWAYGTPVSAPGGAFSGASAWATNLDGLYNASEDSALTSPAFDLSGFAGKLLIVSWRQFLDTEEGYDFAHVEVSKDNGATWAAAQAAESGPVNIVGWTRRQATVDASYATAGFRLRFRLGADETYQFDGWAIDDVAVFATAALFPAGGDFTKSTAPNIPIAFSKVDFTAHYSDPDGGVLTAVTVLQLPANGTLQLAGAAVTAGQSIPADSLAALSYVPPADVSGTETFTWSASNFFGPSAPATVTLSILTPVPKIVIVKDPAAQTVNPATPVTFGVTAVSSLALTYQWRKNQAPISNATGPSFTLNSAAEADEGDYDVVVTNSSPDEVTSAAATLSVNDPVTFNQHPTSASVDEGQSVTLSVDATGTGRLDYQWLKGSTPIPDATFSSLKIVDAKESDTGDYRCVVTNVVGSKTTNPATVTVQLKPRIVTPPISRGIITNGQVTFVVQAGGAGPFTYQWLKDGVEIPGATAPTLVLAKLLTTNEGQYSVRVTNAVGETESAAARLQVFEWKQVAGTYQDVLEHREPVGAATSPFPGRLTATVTKLGIVSGRLEYLGLTYRFVSKFNSELIVERQIKRTGQSPLGVRLDLDPSTLSLAARVSHTETAGAFVSDGKLPLHRYHAQKNIAPQQGRYTVLLQRAQGAPGPDAPAYLIAKVSAAGNVVFTGKLPDGETAACGAVAQFTGRVAFYRPLYAHNLVFAGELSGRLNLPLTSAALEVDGDLAWRKPQQKPSKPLPDAFLATIEAIGSRYVPPAPRQTVIAFPQDKDLLDLDISGPLPGSPLQRWVRLSPANKFAPVPASAENIRFDLVLSTGRVKGAFTEPASRKLLPFEGVVLQAQDQIGGMLLHKTTPGTFLMVPVP